MSSVLDVVKLVCPWGIQTKMLSEGLETSQRNSYRNLRVHGDGSPRPESDDCAQRAWQRINPGEILANHNIENSIFFIT